MMVKEEDGRWYVWNREGTEKLPSKNGYNTEAEADKRLGQIEFFKHQDDQLLSNLIDGEDFHDAQYKGKEVTLNKPFRTPDESKKFAVYARNSRGNVVKVRFGDPDMEIKRDDPKSRKAFRERHNCPDKSDKSTPGYWSFKMWSNTPVMNMTDRCFFDMSTKKVRSVRDGVQEYYGVEIGIQPHDKVFTVYRAPETISAIASELDDIPIINEHIDPSVEPSDSETIGRIKDTEVVEFEDSDNDSTMLLENKVVVNDEVLRLKDAGKKEFSLGYLGKMKEHDVYDFEQYDLQPKHLAIVDVARGGSELTFVDKGKSDMDEIFCDADGSINLERVVEIATMLPEAIKKVPLDKVKEVVPALEQMMGYAEPDKAMMSTEDMEKEKSEAMDQGMESGKEEMMDMEYEDMEEDEKKKFGDSKLYKSIIEGQEKSFSDSQAYKDSVNSAVKKHAQVIEKARHFLPDDYAFADCDTMKVMRDAIATQVNEKFEDSELSLAFKMLAKNSQYESFGDSGKDEYEAIKDKEL